MLALPRRQSHIPPPGHANRSPRILPGGRPCWRCPAAKALIHHRATPTGRPESRPAGAHVGAASPAKPYPTAGPRQQAAPNPVRHPSMLALPRRQSHILPPGHANSPPKIPPAGRPCWRRPAVKAISHRWPTPTSRPLSHRLATPTGRPESHPVAAHVGAAPPAKPYPTAGPRQQAAPYPVARPPMLAPCRRQSHTPPPSHANRPRPLFRPAAAHVGAALADGRRL